MTNILENRIIREKDAVMFDIDDTLIFTNGKANIPIINLLSTPDMSTLKFFAVSFSPTLGTLRFNLPITSL